MILETIKDNLEALNGIESGLNLHEYTFQLPIDTGVQAGLRVEGDEEDFYMKIFFSPEVWGWVQEANPLEQLTYKNKNNWSTATEEISHLLYLEHKLMNGISPFDLSRFELELQANIDTYLYLSVKVARENGLYPTWMKDHLFDEDQLNSEIPSEIHEIYRETSALAWMYAEKLEQKIIARNERKKLFPEIRGFYHLNGNAKARHILKF